MTDAPLVEKKLALIETCVADLRRLARPEMLVTDVREERFAEHTLQIAIQAALDVASAMCWSTASTICWPLCARSGSGWRADQPRLESDSGHRSLHFKRIGPL